MNRKGYWIRWYKSGEFFYSDYVTGMDRAIDRAHDFRNWYIRRLNLYLDYSITESAADSI